jgi:hypothetical protein
MLSDRKEKKPKPKHKVDSWEHISNNVYGKIEWYATRFMLIGTIGVVIGFIGIVYALLNFVFFGSVIQDLNVILGVFIGLGALVASFVLLGWGIFWRKKAEEKTIF